MWSPSYCMAQSAGEWLKGTWQRLMRSTMDVWERHINIFWPNKISNVELYKKSGCNGAVLEIKRQRLRWPGHVLRMPKDSIPKVALKWTPPGKRKRGRPKLTWPSWKRKDCHRVRLRPQLKIAPCGKTLLWPFVPLWTKRVSEVNIKWTHRF